ncbi:aminodeoxychorismate lyase [Priestia megaterium]|nr:aminodeoxychorismate lyase [Priestia megaterium]
MYLYVNGNIKEQSKATISPFDHGYMYGLGVFETFRVYGGHPFLFDDHLQRLQQSLDKLNIEWPYTKSDLLEILNKLLKQNNLNHAYVRLNVSAGLGEIGLQVDTYYQPSTIMYMKPMPEHSSPFVKEGLILETRRNTPEGDIRLKSHHYLNNILAKREIGADPKKEGIFLTKEAHLAEGIVSNLFFVKDGCVYTPSISTGILNGITRQFICKLLKVNGISVQEGFFSVQQLLESDEVFMTNSIQEIFAIEKIGEYEFKTGEETLTYTLQQRYKSYTSSLWSKDQLVKGTHL